MAQDITLDIGSSGSITWTLDSVPDGSSSASSAFDLGATAPPEFGVRITLDGTSASNTGPVYIRTLWSDDNTNFVFSAVADVVRVITMQGTSAFNDVFTVETKARYCKLHLTNDSGDALAASGNSAVYYEIAVDQA